jgi:hypothetical protein
MMWKGRVTFGLREAVLLALATIAIAVAVAIISS